MKRVMIYAILATLLASTFVFAQDSSGEPSAESVLQTARDKHSGTNSSQPGAEPSIKPSDESAQDTALAESQANYPYTPAVIGLIPSLSFPKGIYDANLAAAAIGAVNGKIVGLQASGVFSTTLSSMSGVQTAGGFNIVKTDMTGVQAAGVFNIVEGRMHGLQSAGVLNISDTFAGVMSSGVVNIAKEGKGVMIGLVNVADSLDGVAIGLVNVIKDGIWDINADYQFDSKTAYLTYRSGTPLLYAVLYAGQQTRELLESTYTLTAGAGLGHRFKVLFITVDTELCYETSPIDSYYTIGSLEDYSVNNDCSWDQLAGFGSVRMSFGFGQRKGFGVYLGLKTDFGDSGKFSVPDRFRSSFGKSRPEGTMFFDKIRPIWPKWFIGIRF